MKPYFKPSALAPSKSAPVVVFATLLLAACGDSSAPVPSAQDWPSDLVAPIPGATFSLAEKHLPGAQREYRAGTHQGFDFTNGFSGKPLAGDEPVVAVADGVVVRIDQAYEPSENETLAYYAQISAEPGFVGDHALDQLRGRQVWVRHESGHVSRYAHLSEVHPELAPGDAVQQGQAVGLIGNTGLVRSADEADPAPHLHFELWSTDGSVYLGEAQTPLETHRLVARQFGPDALPRYARRAVEAAEDGTAPDAYPPAELPETGFSVNPPSSLGAGAPFSLPVTWEGDDFTHRDLFALFEGQPLGIIDAGNGAWILGAVPLTEEIDSLRLVVGGADLYGQTMFGSQQIEIADKELPPPLEVAPEIFELYSEENIQLEARSLGPAVLRSLEIDEALWTETFDAPVAGNVIRRFGQPIFHAMLRPAPSPGRRQDRRRNRRAGSASNDGSRGAGRGSSDPGQDCGLDSRRRRGQRLWPPFRNQR